MLVPVIVVKLNLENGEPGEVGEPRTSRRSPRTFQFKHGLALGVGRLPKKEGAAWARERERYVAFKNET